MKDIDVASGSKKRADLRDRVRMFNNDWTDLLDRELKRQFHEKTYPKVALMRDTSMNIFRRIVREICTVYREAATRTIAGVSPEKQDELDALYKTLRIDQTMQVAHRYAKAATMSFLVVRRVAGEDRLVLRVLTPDQVCVEVNADDPTLIEQFAYASEVLVDKKPRTIWTVYTRDARWFCGESGRILKDAELDKVFGVEGAAAIREGEFVNVYETIPVVAFPAEFQVRSFWNEDWNRDAYEANLLIGLLNTYENYLVKTQSFKQIVISADKVSETLKDSILDPVFPMLTGAGAQVTTLDLNTQLAAIDQVIRGKVAGIANNYGISQENFALTTQAQSGFSLKIANQSLQDIRAADIPLCESVEHALYRVIAQVANVEELGDFDPEADLTFNPGEVSWPEEWATEQTRWEFEFKNGIASPVDYLISMDPQLSREEAMAKILERQAEMKQLKPRVSAWSTLLNEPDAGSASPAASALDALAAKGQEGITGSQQPSTTEFTAFGFKDLSSGKVIGGKEESGAQS